IILFTDDDVTPDKNWAVDLMVPLLEGSCDAVTGQITLAENVTRPWLTSAHLWWLASSDDAKSHDGVRELIGANMGFRRSVLDRVPAFDIELGPGAMGFGDDTLFGWQLSEAGFRIAYVPSAGVIHHVDPIRLRRIEWLTASRQRGRSQAYLRYHWEHSEIRFPRARQLYYVLKLQVRRCFQQRPSLEDEGCSLWEMSYVLHSEMCKQFRLERRGSRKYERRGLRKLTPQKQPVEGVGGSSPGSGDGETMQGKVPRTLSLEGSPVTHVNGG
ncbi:glycosyltransferase family 2 protein, partial [Dolichospermum sp. ST_sed3]|nr:glycosyltransferase family 2 protein [Dolichospermum sp. ST_sed3]